MAVSTKKILIVVALVALVLQVHCSQACRPRNQTRSSGSKSNRELELLGKIEGETDQAKRNELVQELQNLLGS